VGAAGSSAATSRGQKTNPTANVAKALNLFIIDLLIMPRDQYFGPTNFHKAVLTKLHFEKA
jgi:hypothetical protein